METYRIGNKTLFFIFILFMFFLCMGVCFGATKDESFQFKLKPSQTVHGQLTVTNTQDFPLDIVIEKKKLLFDSEHLVYSDEGIAKWINVAPTNFTLVPGESKKIQFTVSAPSQINYSDAVGALIIRKTSLDTQTNKDATGNNFNIGFATEIVIPIVVGLPGQIIESLKLSEHKIPIVLLSLMPGEFYYKLENNGTVYSNFTGNIEIKGINGVTNVPIVGEVYPEDRYILKKEWVPGLTDFGIYNVKTVIEYGRLQQVKKLETNDTILVIPAWLIISLLIVLIIWVIKRKYFNNLIEIKIKKK